MGEVFTDGSSDAGSIPATSRRGWGSIEEALELFYEDSDDAPVTQRTFINTMEFAV